MQNYYIIGMGSKDGNGNPVGGSMMVQIDQTTRWLEFDVSEQSGNTYNVMASQWLLMPDYTYDICAAFSDNVMYLYINETLVGTNTYQMGEFSASITYTGIGWSNDWPPCTASGDYNDFQYSPYLPNYVINYGNHPTHGYFELCPFNHIPHHYRRYCGRCFGDLEI